MWQFDVYNHSFVKRAKFEKINKMIDIARTDKILDIGSGYGIVSKLLSKKSDFVYSIELNIDHYNESKTILDNKFLFLGSAEKLPFKDEVFDRILLLDVLYYTNEKKTINECFRVLKKNGILILTVPYSKPTLNLKRFKKLMGIDPMHEGGKIEEYSIEDITHLFHDDFKIIKIDYHSYFFVELFESIFKSIRRATKISKQTSVAEADLTKTNSYRLYRLIYPFFWIVSKFDLIFEKLRFTGHGMIVELVKK